MGHLRVADTVVCSMRCCFSGRAPVTSMACRQGLTCPLYLPQGLILYTAHGPGFACYSIATFRALPGDGITPCSAPCTANQVSMYRVSSLISAKSCNQLA